MMTHKRKTNGIYSILATFGFAFALILGPIAGVSAAERKPLDPMVKVKTGSLNILSDAGLLIAMDKGYFKDEGIENELVGFKAGPQIIPMLATGEVQVSGLSVSPAFFNAVRRDIDMKIVADKGQVSKGAGWAALVIRPDLTSKIKSFKDLKGLKIAVPSRGVSTSTQLGKALQLGGLKPEDIQFVELGFPDMVVALTNKAVDAAMLVEPFVTLASQKKIGVRWKGVDEFLGYTGQNGVIVYSERFMEKQPEVAKRWMVAYLRGVRYYLKALKGGPNREEVIKILIKHTPVKGRRLYDKMAPIGFDIDARVNADSIKADQDWFVKIGLLKQSADLDKVIDNQFVDYAASQLKGH